MIASQFLFSFSEATIETIQPLYVLRTWFFSYVWLNSVNCLPMPSGHSATVSLKSVLKFNSEWVNSRSVLRLIVSGRLPESLSVVKPMNDVLMDHQQPCDWLIFRALLNARPPNVINNNNSGKWPLLCATWYSMTVKGEQTKQSLGGDHCLTATSMNKAVPTTHCGIGIVSELIKWGVEGGGGWNRLGACSHLMPWQHCVPLRTKPQALSFLLPLQW